MTLPGLAADPGERAHRVTDDGVDIAEGRFHDR